MMDERSESVLPHVDLPTSLLEGLVSGRMPHALLLIGPVGPASIARVAARSLAQRLLCANGEISLAEPCGSCPSCVQFASGTHPDYFEVTDAPIRTGDVEAVQRWLVTKGHSGKKVYLLEGVDTMTGVAANRMLKTLEEPEANVYAILTASRRQTVLSTIRSRAFIYELAAPDAFRSSDHDVIPKLQALLGDTENDSFDGFVEKMIRWTEMWLLEREPTLLLAARWQSYCEQVPATDSLMFLAEWLRDILYSRIGASQRRFRDWENHILRFAPILEVEQWANAVQIVLDSRSRLQSHVVALLNFEQMCIRLREVSN
ncbi:DNA polymerase III subunit [Alicyclobacillus acidiphilus]|uniref:DNA polymerase III subunit n=1 Tax=Alicyclobacillus acidiphilus TaxID=182455 RepID=UPI0008322CBE|nr:hypothetical protein [Alicyclobacillus acidiphilus]